LSDKPYDLFAVCYPFYDVVDAFLHGQMDVGHDNMRILISELAPDITFNHMRLFTKPNLISVLGEGGNGIVYVGETKIGKRKVAVKELKADFEKMTDEEKLLLFKEFQHEVFVMSKLKSNYLVRLFGVTKSFPPAMIMELLPEKGLNVLLHDKNKSIPFFLRARIALDVAKAMNYLDHANVVHRDLRSPNVFIMSTNPRDEVVAKVGDFGLAQFCAPKLRDLLKTWQWLPPEVLSLAPRNYDESVDIYSFGIVLWEICTRDYPFIEYDQFLNTRNEFKEIEIKNAVVNKDLRPTFKDGVIPREYLWMKDLACQCWQKNPLSRPRFQQILNTMSSKLKVKVVIRHVRRVSSLPLADLYGATEKKPDPVSSAEFFEKTNIDMVSKLTDNTAGIRSVNSVRGLIAGLSDFQKTIAEVTATDD